MDFYTNLTFKV